MENNCHYVYHLIDPFTNIPFYVGMGQGRRMYFHESRVKSGKKPNNNGHLFNKINKILKTGGNISYCKIVENVSAQEAENIEKLEISKIGRADLGNGPLCNLTDGGEGHSVLSPEIQERKRIKLKYPKSQEHKQKLSAAHMGKKLSSETIEKLKCRPINAWYYKHHHSEEAKSKIAASKRGKTWEEIYGIEEANKMREKLKLRHKLGLMPPGGRK